MKILIIMGLSVAAWALVFMVPFVKSATAKEAKTSIYEAAKQIFMESYNEGYDKVLSKTYVEDSLVMLSALKTGLSIYHANHGGFPDDLSALVDKGMYKQGGSATVESVLVRPRGIVLAKLSAEIFGEGKVMKMEALLDDADEISSWKFTSNLDPSNLAGTVVSHSE